jgi:hypothetical protein
MLAEVPVANAPAVSAAPMASVGQRAAVGRVRLVHVSVGLVGRFGTRNPRIRRARCQLSATTCSTFARGWSATLDFSAFCAFASYPEFPCPALDEVRTMLPDDHSRRALLERCAQGEGLLWAMETLASIHAQMRAVRGGWPGTVSEARARMAGYVLPALARQGLAGATESERELAARCLYHSARAQWIARQESREGKKGKAIPA